MHFTKNIKISDKDWEKYGVYFRVHPHYPSLSWSKNSIVKTWTIEFPRRVKMKINVWTGHDNTDTLVAQGVLYKANDEIGRTDIKHNLATTFRCGIDDRVSYTVNMINGALHDAPDRFTTTRYVPVEKFNAYEAAFAEDIMMKPPENNQPVITKSAWVVNFPHNYSMTIVVGTDKTGRLYVQPFLDRNKRNFKLIKGEPTNTLTKPFIMRHNKMAFAANIVGHEIKKSKPGDET